VTKEGIILTCEKESISKLYERGRHSEKIYTIDRNIAVGVGGLAADANLLIDYSREYSQNYFFKYKTLTPVELVVKYISDIMQTKTQFGSTRPYGAGFLFGGWDKNYGYQLYNTEPSGIYNAWKAHAIGKNDQSAQSSLKQYYENDMSLNDGLKLAVKVLKKSLDKNKMNPDNVEIFVLEKKEEGMSQRFVKSDEIQKFIEIADKEDQLQRINERKTFLQKVPIKTNSRSYLKRHHFNCFNVSFLVQFSTLEYLCCFWKNYGRNKKRMDNKRKRKSKRICRYKSRT
jgi:20S proteasome subunit alpha 3